MKLVNMKMDAAAREKSYPSTVAADAPVYPWGLSLTLDNEALEKLGTGQLPDVGGTVVVIARAKVTGVSSNEYEGGGKHRSVSLQITDMALDPDDAPGGQTEEILYSGS